MFSRAERFEHGNREHSGLFPAFATRNDDLSVVGGGLTVAGDLLSAGEIRVFGAVHGEINCRTVIVAAGGHVEGWIYASSVYVFGSVFGRIEAIEVTVGETATIYGDIYHHILSVDRNAVLDGLRPWRPRSHLAERRPWHPGE
jgi:cytoskeletal protein CcmA (bactofilin family)